MAAMFNNLSNDYLSSFDKSITISGMPKNMQFQFQQALSYAGIQGHISKDFHGLSDFHAQMAAYSSTNGWLSAAWNLIEPLVMQNLLAYALTFADPNLGQVGLLYQTIPGYAQSFGITASGTDESTNIDDALSED